MLKLFLVAGEASADMHGADLVRELRGHVTDLSVYGVGGSLLAAQGMELAVDCRSVNVVGATDWLDMIGGVLRAYRKLLRLLRERRPDCAVLMDLPDFNLRLARKIHRLGIPVVYYISPQVWAWRKYRVKTIRRFVDRMLVLFPFEKSFYDSHGVDAVFVGHPLADRVKRRSQYRPFQERKESPRVALLPGSRKSELEHHGPMLGVLVGELRKRYPAVQIKVPIATTLSLEEVRDTIQADGVEWVSGRAPDVVAWADIAVVASGTATLETALVGTPFCIFYRIAMISNFLRKYIVRYKGFLGMPNLLHGREVVREFFQEPATVSSLLSESVRLIEDPTYYDRMAEDLGACRRLLGTGGATFRAAAEIAKVLMQGRAALGGTLENAFSPA